MTAVIFGWGVVVGYYIACSVVRHYERQPIKVASMGFGQLELNSEETQKVLLILRDAATRKAKEQLNG